VQSWFIVAFILSREDHSKSHPLVSNANKQNKKNLFCLWSTCRYGGLLNLDVTPTLNSSFNMFKLVLKLAIAEARPDIQDF